MEKFQEFFALPVNLKKVFIFDKITLYGSSQLNVSLLRACSKSDLTKPVLSEISKLISRKKIIPCFAEKGLISHFRKKLNIFSPKRVSFLGLYFPEKDIILILIDNNIGLLGFASNEIISAILAHELMHMASSKNPHEFWKIFKTEIVKFYLNLFRIIFSLKGNYQEEVIKISKFLTYDGSFKTQSNLSGLYKKLSILQDFSTTNPEDFQYRKALFFRPIVSFYQSQKAFVQLIDSYSEILKPIYQIYQKEFSINYEYTAVQELICPSEIIAVLTEYGKNSKFKQAVKLIV